MRKILVTDEVRPNLESHESFMMRSNVKVFSASTAEKALELHRREHMELIIADVDMPEMGGDGLCRAIRADDTLRKVYLFLVCDGRKPELRKCEDCGANSFLERPLDYDDVAGSVGRVLDIAQRRDVRVLVKVSVNGAFRSEPFFATSHDLSASGILIETDKTLARGDGINCSFFLPDAERIFADGTVVRVSKGKAYPYSYGIKFAGLPNETMEVIEKFILDSKREG